MDAKDFELPLEGSILPNSNSGVSTNPKNTVVEKNKSKNTKKVPVLKNKLSKK